MSSTLLFMSMSFRQFLVFVYVDSNVTQASNTTQQLDPHNALKLIIHHTATPVDLPSWDLGLSFLIMLHTF